MAYYFTFKDILFSVYLGRFIAGSEFWLEGNSTKVFLSELQCDGESLNLLGKDRPANTTLSKLGKFCEITAARTYEQGRIYLGPRLVLGNETTSSQPSSANPLFSDAVVAAYQKIISCIITNSKEMRITFLGVNEDHNSNLNICELPQSPESESFADSISAAIGMLFVVGVTIGVIYYFCITKKGRSQVASATRAVGSVATGVASMVGNSIERESYINNNHSMVGRGSTYRPEMGDANWGEYQDERIRLGREFDERRERRRNRSEFGRV